MESATTRLVRRLGVAATVLGAIAAVSGSPYVANRAPVDVDALSRAVVHEDDHVTAIELAGWIKDRRAGLRVVDVRTSAEYDAYHVPTAERVPIDSLAATGFRPDETIVLYSEGGTHAAQAWVFLRALGFAKVYFLRGGLYEWVDDVMNASLAQGASHADTVAFDAAAPLSRYFGGVPRTGVEKTEGDVVALPVKSSGERSTWRLVSRIRRRGC